MTDSTQPIQRERKSLLKVIIAFALGAVLALTGLSFTSATPNDDVVVTVNGKTLTKEAFYQRLEEEAGEYVLDQMILELLIEQAQDTEGVDVSDDEILEEIAFIKENYSSEEEFLADLERLGFTLDRLHQEIRLSLIVDKLSRRGIEISDEEIAEFFEANRTYLDQPTTVVVRHILVETEEEATALLKQLDEGADFALLAQEHSLDTYSAIQGGMIGPITPDDPLVESFKAAAFDLNAGEVSQPVESEYGWHIIRVDERIEAKEATLENSTEQIREILSQQQARSVGEIVEELRSKATIEVHWGRYASFATGQE